MTEGHERIYVFKRFERFWHWSQAALIIFMAITGFEIHGMYALFGFEKAVDLHTVAAWALIVLWAFAIFWHLTTGEWRQYVPTTRNLGAMARYYCVGIFKGTPHPFRVTRRRKLNPLQRLAYLLFKVILAPAIWITGLLYLYYNSWAAWGLTGLDLGVVAMIHTAVAFLLVTFLVGHVYLTTTGHTPLSDIRAMITGWEDSGDEALPEQRSIEDERRAA
jgi:thiosulfate reductase cytochrome b subunit